MQSGEGHLGQVPVPVPFLGSMALQPRSVVHEWNLAMAADQSLPASGKPPRRISKDAQTTATNASGGGVSMKSTGGSSNGGSEETSGTVATLDNSRLKDAANSQYVEQCTSFVRSQQDELVSSLHDEVDRLKRKNRELQFCVVMMQHNMRTNNRTQRQYVDYYATAPSEYDAPSRASFVAEEDSMLIGSGETPQISDKKLDELRTLFLEEEIKDLKKRLDEEKQQTQQLADKLRTTEHQLALERLRVMSTDHQSKPSLPPTGGAICSGSDDTVNGTSASQQTATSTGLPFSATVEPLLVHFPPHPPRPPTLQECQTIVKYLYTANSQQSYELKQLKLDLHDVLYSHKWTPDAFLLARSYIVDDHRSSETVTSISRSLPRVPLKHNTKRLPESAYQAKDQFSLPPMTQVVSNVAIERRKRAQQLQRQKTTMFNANL